jgi:hypothetical protein
MWLTAAGIKFEKPEFVFWYLLLVIFLQNSAFKYPIKIPTFASPNNDGFIGWFDKVPWPSG